MADATGLDDGYNLLMALSRFERFAREHGICPQSARIYRLLYNCLEHIVYFSKFFFNIRNFFILKIMSMHLSVHQTETIYVTNTNDELIHPKQRRPILRTFRIRQQQQTKNYKHTFHIAHFPKFTKKHQRAISAFRRRIKSSRCILLAAARSNQVLWHIYYT